MTPEAILEAVRESMRGNLCESLGMEILHAEMGQLKARMPVDHRTRQPFGLLHGGASVALAETLGSIGANMLAGKGRYAVGMEINANHLRAVRDGLLQEPPPLSTTAARAKFGKFVFAMNKSSFAASPALQPPYATKHERRNLRHSLRRGFV